MPVHNRGGSPTPVKQFSSQVSWEPNGTGHFDVVMLGDDGKLRHIWFITGQGWFGPEILTDAG